MKTYRDLYPALVDKANLRSASAKAAHGKRLRPAVAAYLFDEPFHLMDIHDLLVRQAYRFGPYTLKLIYEPKLRLIAAAPVRDRVVHHAIYQVMAPLFIPRFTADNFACLQGRGVHRAVLKFQHYYRRFPWCIRIDVRRYFPTIRCDVLLQLLEHRIRDEKFIALVQQLLLSGLGLYQKPWVRQMLRLDELQLNPFNRGLPVGNLTSQFFGLLYLDQLDHYVKRVLKAPGYVRYVDDMVIFGQHHRQVAEWAAACAEWLWENRSLRLDQSARPVHCPSQRTVFLGYEISRTERRIRAAARRRLRKAVVKILSGEPSDDLPEHMYRSMVSRAGFALF